MSNTVVISGTSMDVGKSTLTKAVCRALLAKKTDVVAIKPVEVWCNHGPTFTEDGYKLSTVTGQKEPRAALRRYSAIGVPPIAAAVEGETIEWAPLVEDVKRYSAGHDVALIETLGGICTPITWEHDYLALAKTLSAPVLLIGRDRAQGAAEVLLAMRAVKSAGVPVLGVALTVPPKRDGTTGSNAAVIRRFSGEEKIIMIPNARMDQAAVEYHHDLSEEMMSYESVQTVADWIVTACKS